VSSINHSSTNASGLDPERILAELIAIPSVNPMGMPYADPPYLETQLTNYLQDLFDRIGLPWERQTVAPGRDNIFARLDSALPPRDGGRLILLDAHQDTVQVDGMDIPPWTPTIREGRIYGRGSCDTKGGMAAMLAAVDRLIKERPANMPTIILGCSMNEEFGATGAAAYEDFWQSEAQSIFERPPDAAIIMEPTDLNVVVAHKGTVRWPCRTHGLAVHSSRPELGRNAIYAMRHVLNAVEAYQRQVCPTLPGHPLCGRPTVNVGLISGGRGINTVADECRIVIERRITPFEELDSARREVIDYIAGSVPDNLHIEHDAPLTSGGPLSDEGNEALADKLLHCAEGVQSGRTKTALTGGSNAGKIAPWGVPCVLFGPGSINQAHTRDEWLPLSELHQAVEILYRFCREG
jgi:acetylornithine deacetylase